MVQSLESGKGLISTPHMSKCWECSGGQREVILLAGCSPAHSLREGAPEAQLLLPASPSCAGGQAAAFSATMVGGGEEGSFPLPPVKLGCSQMATLLPPPQQVERGEASGGWEGWPQGQGEETLLGPDLVPAAHTLEWNTSGGGRF